MKVCNVCRQEKALDQYHRRAKSLDGLSFTCKACKSAQAKARYVARSAEVKERAARWAAANPLRRRQIQTASDRRRHQQRATYSRQWRAANLDRAREQGRRAQAVRRSRECAAGAIPQEWWNAILEVVETGACLYCGRIGGKLTIDHFIPVSRAGKTQVGNLIPCCKSCNARKHNKMPEEFFTEAEIASLSIFLEASKAAFLEERTITEIDG